MFHEEKKHVSLKKTKSGSIRQDALKKLDTQTYVPQPFQSSSYGNFANIRLLSTNLLWSSKYQYAQVALLAKLACKPGKI
jgi:hypothetical protein